MKRFEIYLRNFLLRVLLFFNPVKHVDTEPVFSSRSSLIFIRLNRIGDALVSTPLFKIIKEKLGCRITVLADSKNHFIFRNNPNIDEVIVFRKGLSAFTQFRNLSNNFDAVIDLHDDISTTVSYLVALARCKYKFGLKKGNSKIFTNSIERLNSETTHIVDRILHILKLFGINEPGSDTNIQYFPNTDAVRSVEEKLNLYFENNNLIVGINISAGSDARFWGIERFKKLLDQIDSDSTNILIISAEKDIKFAEKISSGKYKIFCSPDFNEFAAVVSKLNFLFTPDTSIIHLASAYRVPTFGIYVKYNTKDLIWSPYKSEFECVITEEANFDNLSYKVVMEKFIPFYQKFIY